MPNATTRDEAIDILWQEATEHAPSHLFGDLKSYAAGLLEGMVIGFGNDLQTFLAIHGSPDRLRHYARKSLIQQGHMKDPSAPPAGVA